MNQREARNWMRKNVSNHVDQCGEVNTTALAESCCDAFDCADGGGPLDDDTHWIWDIAFDVGERYEDENQ